VHALGQPVGDHAGQGLGRGVAAGQLRLVVEVAVGEPLDDGVQRRRRPPDVDHDPVGVEFCAPERGVDDVGGAVQALGRPEHLAAQAVRDHHVVADGDAIHRPPPRT
jgi:hypothetical protein